MLRVRTYCRPSSRYGSSSHSERLDQSPDLPSFQELPDFLSYLDEEKVKKRQRKSGGWDAGTRWDKDEEEMDFGSLILLGC